MLPTRPLSRVTEIDPHLLPADFSGTIVARCLTSETRRRVSELLAQGKVVAIFPGGPDLALFQITSRVSYPRRIELIIFETRCRTGRSLSLIGKPITVYSLRQTEKAKMALSLRCQTMATAGTGLPDEDEVIVWSSHVQW